MSDNKTIKTMKSKKVKISIQGNDFLIPSESIGYDTYNNNEPYVYMRAKVVASIIKQFVKNNFSDLVVSSTSDVYSGGSSVRVNVCNQDGSSVHQNIFEQISEFGSSLKGGSFNGMIDMYESREDKPTTDNGTPMKYFPSYIFVENKPNWGTKHYWMAEWNKWLEITDLNYTPTDNEKEWIDNVVQKYGGWLGYNKQYMSKSVLKNIDSIMGCI
jgi:hypothetical protein